MARSLTLLETLLTIPSKVGVLAFPSNSPLIGTLSCKVVTGGSAVLGGSSTTTGLDTGGISIPTPGRETVLSNTVTSEATI